MVVNLTHGRVGALEYRPRWPRLDDRYADRFVPGQPVVCVDDPTLSRSPGEDRQGALWSDSANVWTSWPARIPGRVRRAWSIDHFEVWEADLPLAEIFDGGAVPLPSGPPSANVSGTSSAARP